MAEVVSFVFTVGAALTDSLEVWVLALMGLIIGVDLLAGRRLKPLLFFGIAEAAGLVGGYFWASHTAHEQDVSGPYAWALVVGVWCILTVLTHTTVALVWLLGPHRRF